MKKKVLAASMAALLCSSAQADTLLGLYIGGQMWANEASGSFGEGGDTQSAFEFDDKNQGSYFVALEHPIPLIPNIKIASTTLDTTLEASFVDYTLYYEVFDNDLLSFDFGLTGRDLDASINVSAPLVRLESGLDVSGIIPMAYLSTIVGLPFTGLSVFAEANFITYDDQTIYDAQLGVSYALLDNLAVDLDLTLGYRALKLEINDLDDFYSDLSYDGFFAGAVVHF
jgi:outer membrane protein